MADYSAAIELDMTVNGTGDVEHLTEAFEKLSRSQAEITADFQKAIGAAKQAQNTYQVQTGTVNDAAAAYEVMDDQLGNVTDQQMKNAAAAQWMAKQTQALNDTLEELAQHEREAERATVAVTAAQTKAGQATKDAGEKSGGYGALKWLLLSNAIQDAQFGLQNVINNSPGIIQAFGGSAGIAGAVQIAGVAASVLANNFGTIADLFGKGLPDQLPNDVKALTAYLDQLEAKKVKLDVDYDRIKEAQRALDNLSESQAAFDRLAKQKSRATQESGRRATEAVVEYGGGDDFDSGAAKIAGAAAGLTPVEDSAETRKLREQLAEARADAKNAIDAQAKASLLFTASRREGELNAQIAKDREGHEANVKGRIGRAGEGRSDDVNWLLGLVRANPEVFANRGVEEGFSQALGKASRNVVDRDALDKLNEPARKAEEAAAQREQAERDKADVHGERVSQENSERAARTTEKNRLDAEKDAAQARAKADKETKARTAKAEQTRATQVKLVGTGFNPEIEADLARNELAKRMGAPVAKTGQQEQRFIQAGQQYSLPDDVLNRRSERSVGDRLKRSGNDPALAPAIVDQASKQFQSDITQQVAAGQSNVNALIAVGMKAQAQIDQLKARNQSQAMQIQGLQNRQRMSNQQRPSLLINPVMF